MPELTASEWDAFLTRFPEAHLLQTSAWGELKSAFGWDVVRIASAQAGAQILFRRLPLGLSLAYIPKGPLNLPGDQPAGPWRSLWPEIDALCRRRKAIFLKVEPDLWEPVQYDAQAGPLKLPGFRHSPQDIQPARTLLVDLSGSEDQILARMKQKTRYNIRLALKKGIVVASSGDIGLFHRLMIATGQRDAFGVHSQDYYQRAYDLFHPSGSCSVFVAEYQGQPLAALMVFARSSRAWYFYGASSNDHRERMPTYLLQWEAMRWAIAQGCTLYDLWGVPDVDETALEAQFASRSDGLWGVYRFKRGFGGQLRRAQGPWDRAYSPVLYALYRFWLRLRRSPEHGW
jgi:peptidoglycan pentaglycine glycine transferase (the first glycine)